MELAGPFGTPLGLAQRKRASPRGAAGDAPSEDLLSQAARLLQAAEGEQARMQRVAAMF